MSTVYLFPGQASQHVGMGHTLYEREPAARAVFDQADEALGFPLSELCFHGPEEALTDTVNQQPAIYVTSLAAWAVLRERGWPAATYVAGHSLGEFSALAAVGSLAFTDGLALVRRRGELMKAAGEAMPGEMAAILALDLGEVEKVCTAAQEVAGQPVQVANDNCPGQVVISGDREAVREAVRRAKQAGARKVITLPITIAAHSPLMEPAVEPFTEAIQETPFSEPSVPVIGNTTGRPLTDPDAVRAELTAQLTGSVRWTESMQYLREQGVETFIEVGPGDVLTGLMKRIDRKATRKAFKVEEGT